MIGTICWVITLGYNIAATFVWTRTFKEFRCRLKEMQQELLQIKHDVRQAMHESSNNRLNILETRSLCKATIRKEERLIDSAVEKMEKKCEAESEKIHEVIHRRDEAIVQRFSDVYSYVNRCREDRSLLKEAMATLPKPCMHKKRGRPRKKKEEECRTNAGKDGTKTELSDT